MDDTSRLRNSGGGRRGSARESRLGAALQFVKYAIVGAIATGVNVAAFFTAAITLFPCLTADDKAVAIISKFASVPLPEMTDAARSLNAAYCNVAAYFVSNVVCYILNRMFVFKPGRHGMAVEAALFFLVSGVSLAVGAAGQTALIAIFGVPTSLALAANLVASLSINFLMRKFVIFKG